MCLNDYLILGIFTFGFVALVGFFMTKTTGFGKYTTSSLLLILVTTISSLLFVGNKIEAEIMTNILFAVIGFAGGLFTGKENGNASNK